MFKWNSDSCIFTIKNSTKMHFFNITIRPLNMSGMKLFGSGVKQMTKTKKKERKRERETETETVRQRDRHTDREEERETARERETDRQTEKEKNY